MNFWPHSQIHWIYGRAFCIIFPFGYENSTLFNVSFIKLDLDILSANLRDKVLPSLFYCFVPSSSRTSTKRSFHIRIAITKQPQYTELRQQFFSVSLLYETLFFLLARRHFLVRFTLWLSTAHVSSWRQLVIHEMANFGHYSVFSLREKKQPRVVKSIDDGRDCF